MLEVYVPDPASPIVSVCSDTMVTPATLQTIPFFSDFTRAEIDSIAAVMLQRMYQPREILFLEREPSPGLFFITRGRVRVYRSSPSGKEQALCLLTPRTCFGGCPIFDGKLSPVTAQALDETVIYLLPKSVAIAQSKNSQVLAMALLKVFAGRLDHLTLIIDGLTFNLFGCGFTQGIAGRPLN